MQRITSIKLRPFEDERILVKKAARLAGFKETEVKYFSIVKKSLDARNKNDVFFTYTVDISSRPFDKKEKIYAPVKKSGDVLVVGAGPAGLFSALDLLRHGFKVTLIERGKSVDERANSVDSFIKTAILDEDSNIQFGEGGAGAFSDGKLNTQVGGDVVKEVIDDFLRFGAPSEIGYLQKPHIGSDNLKSVVKNIRNEIIRLGGNVRFQAKLTGLEILGGKVTAVYINGVKEVYDEIVLAVGHSARDVYKILSSLGVAMESKDFAVGLRIEHLQKDINLSQYGEKFFNVKGMPVAEYKLTSNQNGRGVFTFCMCPGGYVMPSQSERETVVVNGMSNFKRDGENANSAVIAQVSKADFGAGLFDGMNFQAKIEKKAFEMGGGDYKAPAMLVGDFLSGKTSTSFGKVAPSYAMGVKKCDLTKLLGDDLSLAIKGGISDMAKRVKCFDSYDGVLTGIESRTSSPVRVVRNLSFESVSASNLYPCGEGCGYAGGITSAGADGKKVARALAIKYGAEIQFVQK